MAQSFDEAELLERIDHDWEFLSDTVEMLGADGQALIQEIRQAIEAGDAAAVGRVAHTVKGMVANFCAAPAHASALELEKMGRAGELSDAPPVVAALDAQLQALTAELQALVARER